MLILSNFQFSALWYKDIMISDQINNLKVFMNKLLTTETFDEFLVTDITLSTFNTFHIDGLINKDFYSPEEYETLGSPLFASWKILRPICFNLIKGNHTPLKFKFIFCLNHHLTEQMIKDSDAVLLPSDVNKLFLNIKFENNILTYTTGTSLNIFTLDKTLEKYFDQYISTFISTLVD